MPSCKPFLLMLHDSIHMVTYELLQFVIGKYYVSSIDYAAFYHVWTCMFGLIAHIRLVMLLLKCFVVGNHFCSTGLDCASRLQCILSTYSNFRTSRNNKIYGLNRQVKVYYCHVVVIDCLRHILKWYCHGLLQICG